MANDAADATQFSCRNCRNPIALRTDLLSKNFVAKSGGAYKFSHAMNVVLGGKEERQLLTGSYTVANVYCSRCREVLGWKYVRASEPNQKSKEGNFIIEKMKIAKEY